MRNYIVRAWCHPVLWWGLTLLCCGVIFYFSAQPQFTGERTLTTITATAPSLSPGLLEQVNFWLRKSAHAIGFATLGILVWRALTTWPHPRRAPLLAWLVTALYAVTDEFHQSMVPGRSGTLHDVLLDVTAAGIVLLILPDVITWWQRSSSRWEAR